MNMMMMKVMAVNAVVYQNDRHINWSILEAVQRAGASKNNDEHNEKAPTMTSQLPSSVGF